MLISVEKDPDNANTHRNLAEIYISQGNFEKALGEINEAIDIEPETTEYFKKRAQIYRGLGMIAEALEDEGKTTDVEA